MTIYLIVDKKELTFAVPDANGGDVKLKINVNKNV